MFVCGRGSDTSSLKEQAKILWHNTWNTPSRLVRASTGKSEKAIAGSAARWRNALAAYTEKKQECLQVGGDWQEIEADEVCLRHTDVKVPGKQRQVQWNEYVGIKRGARKSLILHKRPAAKCFSTRARPVRRAKAGRACPPPYTSEEWKVPCSIAREG